MMRKVCLLITGILVAFAAPAQQAVFSGKIVSNTGEPVGFAYIAVKGGAGQYTDTKGNFRLHVPAAGDTLKVSVNHTRFKEKVFFINPAKGDTINRTIILKESVEMLDEVDITSQREDSRNKVSTISIDPESSKDIPSPFGDFNSVVKTLPGVTANNELSSTYSVRGGNFDENLVYVNDMKIYRPFLAQSGRQEGLSFVNPDLVSDVSFSAGGWQPRYGDKLASVLSIEYKQPDTFKAGLDVGLLGGSAYVQGTASDKDVTYIAGVRQKRSQYLLQTLETQGEYLPRYTDVQSYITIDLDDKEEREKGKSTLGILGSYARNRYLVEPVTRETTFGTNRQPLQLQVAFEGREVLEYDIWQGGVKLTEWFSKRYHSEFFISGFSTKEREFSDVEAGYRLCDIAPDPSGSNFNQCVFTRGVGTIFNHSRNQLDADVLSAGYRSVLNTSDGNHEFQWGARYSFEHINDRLSEYRFIDSAGYAKFTHRINTAHQLESNRYKTYAQHTWYPDSLKTFTYGFRMNYWDLNNEFLFSPRLQYSWKPASWSEDVRLNTALGMYHQPPFYRALRNREGELNRNIKAQTSVHAIAGMNYKLSLWGRDFILTSEGYFKYMYNVIPYDINNVRIRYFGKNMARAYATGVDFRMSGEFINDEESWFSLGIMQTQEDLEGDDKKWIRRPTDQRITAGIFFRDHIPDNPTIKMYLRMQFGSGLPFGPPGNDALRNSFQAPPYRRVDMGFTKLLSFQDQEVVGGWLETLWLRLEVLNVIGANNTISYLWIRDVNNRRFAVPNTLSARFLNAKIKAEF